MTWVLPRPIELSKKGLTACDACKCVVEQISEHRHALHEQNQLCNREMGLAQMGCTKSTQYKAYKAEVIVGAGVDWKEKVQSALGRETEQSFMSGTFSVSSCWNR